MQFKQLRFIWLYLLIISPAPLLADDVSTARISFVSDHVEHLPPYRWALNCVKGGESTGTIIHVVDKLFKDIATKYQWIPSPQIDPHQQLNRKYQQLISQEIDFLVMPKIILDKFEHTLTGIRLYDHHASVITHADTLIYDGNFSSLKSYKGGIYAVPGSSSAISENLQTQQVTLEHYPKIEVALSALISGKIDYLISDRFASTIWAHQNNIKQKLQFSNIGQPLRQVYLVTKKGGKFSPLIEEMNTLVTEYNNNGYNEFIQRHYLIEWVKEPCQ